MDLYSDDNTLNQVVKQLMNEFKMTDLGSVKQFMGLSINIDKSKGILTIDQAQYANKILKKFEMKDCKPRSSPMEIGLRLSPAKENLTENPYRELVGSLMYLVMGTRPDIAFALNYFSRFQESASDEHYGYLKGILRYIKSTVDMKLCYRRYEDVNPLLGFVDADWAADTVERKSTSGFLFKAFGNTIIWSSKKQPIVALSSTESEYVSACEACKAAKEALWLRKIFYDMKIILNEPIILFEDNQGCIFMSETAETKRTKHMDTRYKFLKQIVKERKIKLEYVDTRNQEADLLTKSLSSQRLKDLIRKLDMY